ncbi:MAG: SDR family oxidoreductase [Gammaproteobacteria bacterium]
MQIDLTGKVVVVTGGRQGLGNCLVSNFLREGCQVVTCSRDGAGLQQVIDGWEATYPGQIAGGGYDVSTMEGVQELIDLAVNRFGGIDVVVNNAATTASGTLTGLTDDQWHDEFDIKLMSMVRTARAAAPIMKARGGGSIVNINAIFAKQPHLGFYASSVIRAGSLNLTSLLAKELAADGIRANAVGLGLCSTEVWESYHDPAQGSYEEFLTQSAEFYGVPMKRLGTPQEITNVALFLASDAASYVTGTQIDVDGGLAAYS